MCKDRLERLAADHRGMLALQDRPFLSWIATKGELPYAEEYILTVRLRTYALTAQSGRYAVRAINGCTVKVTLWDSYPNVAPDIRMLSIPPIFHPDWYSKGVYCPGEPWSPDTALADHVLRMLGTVRYDPGLINDSRPANYKALSWYKKSRGSGVLFPSDGTELTLNTPERAAELEQALLSPGEIIDSWEISCPQT